MTRTPDDPRLELLQGTLDMLILRTLRWGPQHGHGIGQAIRRQSEELLRVETGSLYPALHRLVKRGWLKSEWGVSEANQRAKFYRLTPSGRAQLIREQDRWSQLVRAIGRIMNPAPAGEEWSSHATRRPRPRGRNPQRPGAEHSGTDRAWRGSTIRPASRPRGIRVHGGRPRLDASGLVQPLVRRHVVALPGNANRPAFSSAHPGTGDHRGRDARARHRRQCGDLQRRSERAPASARQSGCGSAALHPPDRAGHRDGGHQLLDAGDRRPRVAREVDLRVRRFLHRRLHADRVRRGASRRDGRRGQRIVLRRHGAPAGARAADQFRRRRARRRRRSRS